jgi:uncharacterized protein YqeY
MSKYTDIKELYTTVRKARDKVSTSILRLVLGELDTDAKRGIELSDEFIVGKIKKMVENINFCISKTKGDTETLKKEVVCLEQFLPKQLNEYQLFDIISNNNPSNIGEAMKFLTKNYLGEYNGKLAKKVVLEYLS